MKKGDKVKILRVAGIPDCEASEYVGTEREIVRVFERPAFVELFPAHRPEVMIVSDCPYVFSGGDLELVCPA